MPWKAKTMQSPHAGQPRPERRLGPRARGYNRAWERIRAAHLQAQPNCVQCGRPGQHVDHRLPLAQGGTHDEANLQTLCASCHSRKTTTRDGGFGHQVKR